MGLVDELRTAFRALRARPGFSLLVIGMLALGIAGNTAIFSLFNGMFLRPLPFEEPERLVDLDETAPKWNLEFVGISNWDFHAWRARNRTFDRMAFFTGGSGNLSGRGAAQRVRRASVTHDMLSVLRLKPALGRDFLPEDDKPGAGKVALIGYDLWQRLFNGSPEALGRILELDKEPYTIVGVLPRTAVFPSEADLWVPLAVGTEGTGWYLSGIGRLKPGVSMEQAQADLLRVHRSLVDAGQKANEITSPRIMPVRDRALGQFRPVAWFLLGGVGIVLLIACVNISGLMMVRGASRMREIGIRTALGASRWAIVRHLFAESLLLSAAGGAAGALLGMALFRAMQTVMPDNAPDWLTFQMDARFAAFAIAVTALAAVLSGLAPALQASRVDTRASMEENATRTGMSRGRRGVLSVLVVGEIALALILLTGAGLVLKAFRNVLRVDPGFRAESALTYLVSLPEAKYAKPEQVNQFYERYLERLRALPGVTAAGAAAPPPLMGHSGTFFTVEGAPPLGPNDSNPVTLLITATPGYMEALGVQLLAGRTFTARDGQNAPSVAIVNESFAKRYWPHENPIGKRIRYSWQKDKWIEVVGVTRDVKHYGLDQPMRQSVAVPQAQNTRQTLGVVLRTATDPVSLVPAARAALERMDPDLPVFEVRTMTENVARSLWARRAYSWLFGAFAAVALALAAAGLYGVISYAVAQRTHEIGVRMALGAQPGRVMRQVLGQGMLLACIGGALGLAGALGVAGFMKSILFGVNTRDPFTYVAVFTGVAFVAMAANLAPARRAARVDPMRALRFE